MSIEILAKAGIYLLMAVGIIGAAGAVLFRSLFHAGLALAGVLIAIAGIYVALNAEFVAMVQVLVYAGAVMTLIIYAIMLTARLGQDHVRQNNKQSIPAALAGIAFIILISGFFKGFPWGKPLPAESAVSIKELGHTLMTTYVFPFEVLGVLLFAVLIGAIVIARRDKE